MKRKTLFLILLFASTLSRAQITLEDCQQQAQQNYPLIHKYGLIDKSLEYDLSNASKGYLPQFSVSGKATYQSDITKSPISLPNVNIKSAPKDQYQAIIEMDQTIWDGGDISSRKKISRAAANVDKEKTSVDMYALNDRVNQLYFGILLIDEQLKQNQLLIDELERIHAKVSNYIKNGIANQSDLDAVSVEILDNKQKRVEQEMMQKAYLNMLSAFIGKEINAQAKLLKPSNGEHSGLSNNNKFDYSTNGDFALESNRPELKLFDAQKNQLNIQESSLNNRLKPHFGLFVQGGLGNPGLNMLQDKFNTFYMAGVRMAWNFGSLYTLKNDRLHIDNKRNEIDNARDVFLFNSRLQAMQDDSKISSMRKQMKDDEEIIRLRENISKAAQAKVENGTLTVTDMLSEITKENISKQTKNIHEIQLLMDIYQLKHTLNK